MRSPLLIMHIKSLRLRLTAPYPSQLIGRAAKYLRLVVVK